MDKYEPSADAAKPWWIKNIDKIFLGGGVVYLLFVSFWLLFQSRQPDPVVMTETDVVTVDEDDQQFIAYLQQSLETLKEPAVLPPQPAAMAPPTAPNSGVDPAQNNQNTVAIAPANQGNPLPPPPPPGAIPQGNVSVPASSNSSTTVVERYYYPVYPNAPTAPAAPQPVAAAPPAAPMVSSVTKHDLVGVLESGDRSSALFRWNGMTQRIQIGEAIGSSGWQLASVNGQQALLSRQGKTRYLEVGQSF